MTRYIKQTRTLLFGVSKSEWLRYIPAVIAVLAYVVPIRICLAEDEAFEDGYYYYPQQDDGYYEVEEDDTDDNDDNFYHIQDDDYVSIEHQSSKIYVSSISDVILCLLCTFFWVLWLVGTIFPSRIQDLYRNEGIVVQGDVLESHVSNDHDRTDPAFEGLEDVDDEAIFDGPNLPTYHAIVSYVVPDRVVRGRRGMSGAVQIRMKHVEKRNSTSFDSIDPRIKDMSRSPPKGRNRSFSPKKDRLSISPPKTRDKSKSPPKSNKKSASPGRDTKLKLDHSATMKTLSRQLNVKVNKINESPRDRRAETPPRPPRSMVTPTRGRTAQNPKQKSLLDGFSNSFDTDCYFTKTPTGDIEKQTPNKETPTKKRLNNDDVPYYKYNRPYVYYIDDDEGDDEFDQDPEKIGSFFQSLDVHSKHYASLGHFLQSLGLVTKESSNVEPSNERKETAVRGPLRVKKRFDTSQYIRPGHQNVEVIVLPGNPGSGILKSEFEEEDFMLNDNPSFVGRENDEINEPNSLTNGGLTDLSSGIIGVVLAAVSTIGAVHGALTLPYKTRVYGWILVVFSLSLMWPAAMLTYKTVNRFRLFMTNKIISFEPCGEKSALYRLRNLPRAKLTCSGGSGNNSGRRDESESGSGNDYVIMVDTASVDCQEPHKAQSFHDDSSVSSLSGDLRPVV